MIEPLRRGHESSAQRITELYATDPEDVNADPDTAPVPRAIGDRFAGR
jgi:hypothetical protein